MEKTNNTTGKQVYNLIIVDESGSMDSIREQAFTGLNETIKTITAAAAEYKDIRQSITLLTFDSDHTRFVFDNVDAHKARLLKWDEYVPGACTPLYDAIGRGISKVNALCRQDDNVLVTIITDGYENASREYTLKMVNTLIDKLKKQGWTFTFIGTNNLDVKEVAMNLGINNHLSFEEDADGTAEMFKCEMFARRAYYSRRANDIDESEGDYFNQN